VVNAKVAAAADASRFVPAAAEPATCAEHYGNFL